MKIRMNKKGETIDLLYQEEERIDLSSPGAQDRLKQALREKLTFKGIAEKYRRYAQGLLGTDLDPERADDLRSMLFRLDEADQARDRGDLDGALMNAFLAGKMVVAVDTLPLAKKGFDAQGGRCLGGGKKKTDPYVMEVIRRAAFAQKKEGYRVTPGIVEAYLRETPLHVIDDERLGYKEVECKADRSGAWYFELAQDNDQGKETTMPKLIKFSAIKRYLKKLKDTKGI